MTDYLFLMHGDATEQGDWASYLAKLRASGRFRRGSSIGAGIALTKTGSAASTTAHIAGYIRVEADDIEHARVLLAGNPVFEGGGTVEIRELPRDET